MKQIIPILLLLAAGQYSTKAMDQEQQEQAVARREILARAAQASLNPQAQPEEHTLASLAGLPVELQKQIAVQVLTSSPTLKQGLRDLLKLARSNRQLFHLLTDTSFLNQVKKIIQLRNQQAELNKLLIDYSQTGNIYAIKLLLLLGSDVNTVGVIGRTALMFAALIGNKEIVQALLAANANVDATTSKGATALMLAASRGQVEIIRTLLAARAHVNIADDNGWTALMLAAMKGSAEAVQVLLKAGANPNATDNDGKTVFVYALESRNPAVLQLIKDAFYKR